jgi:hypothetical protein
MHYDPTAVFRSIDQHKLALVPMALAFVLNYVWFIDGMRIARRERRYSMPIAATYVFMAHDIAYVAHFSRWFGAGGHWFSELFWFGMVLSIVMELLLLAQTIEYGHAEHGPGWSRAMWSGAVLAGLAATMTIWWVVVGTFDDHLFLMSLALVTAAYPPMGMALILHRRGAAGQTVVMWGAFTALTLFWYPAGAYGFGEQFRSWPWLGLGALTAAWGALNTWLVSRARRTVPPSPPPGGAAEPLTASSLEGLAR